MTAKKFIPQKPIPYTLNTVEEFDDFIARAEASPVMTFEEGKRYVDENFKKLLGARKNTTISH